MQQKFREALAVVINEDIGAQEVCPKCKKAFNIEQGAGQDLTCKLCKYSFCSRCRKDPHGNVDCAMAGIQDNTMVDLIAPANHNGEQSLLEQHYIYA